MLKTARRDVATATADLTAPHACTVPAAALSVARRPSSLEATMSQHRARTPLTFAASLLPEDLRLHADLATIRRLMPALVAAVRAHTVDEADGMSPFTIADAVRDDFERWNPDVRAEIVRARAALAAGGLDPDDTLASVRIDAARAGLLVGLVYASRMLRRES
jgi:hypothetical protein